MWHSRSMSRVRISTTVDEGLLAEVRRVSPGSTDSTLVESAFEALLRSRLEHEIDRQYAAGYSRAMPGRDAWGHLEEFLDEAGRL